MIRKLLILAWLACLSGLTEIAAQSLTVSGQVTDDENEALPGVSVLVQGTTTGTVTDIEGQYTINVPDENAVLMFSYIGFTKKEVAVNGQSTLDVTLQPDIQQLSEVVVVGYGETQREDLVSSVASIGGEEINKFKTGNAAFALQGKLPGVRVVQPSGGPGAQPNIYIRGVSSLQGGTNPLIVVDGVPIYSGGLNSINPNDIKSIDVLKDASAAAIYGSKAASGVVLVTTKRGNKNSSQLSVDLNYQVQNLRKPYEMAGTDEYIRLQRLKNPAFFMPAPAAQDTTLNTDWWDAVIREYAPIINTNISYTGGSDKSNYAAALGYFRQDAQTQLGGWQRVTARFNGDFGVTDWLKLGVAFAPRYETWKNYAISDFLGLLGNDPTTPIRRGDLNHIPEDVRSNYDLEWSGWGYPYARISNNPVNYYYQMVRAELQTNRVYGIQSNAYLEIKPLEGLTFTSKIGGNVDNQTTSNFSPKYYLDPQAFSNLVSATSSFRTSYNWVWFNTLGYSKTFADNHNLKVLVGQEAQYIDAYYGSATRYSSQNGNDPLFRSIDVLTSDRSEDEINRQYPGTSGATTDINVREAISSYLGRVEYNYASKYYFTGNIRRDGNSKFGDVYQYAVFPSLSLGWRISEESFLGSPDWLSNLMLKVRWGQRGNSNPIPPTATYDLGRSDWRYSLAGTTVFGYGLWRSGNPNLQWETDVDRSLGLDASFFDGRLSSSLEVFDNRAKNLLLNAPIQPSYGTQYDWGTSQWLNFGELSNRGWEWTLNYQNAVGDLNYSAGLILSRVKSVATRLYGEEAFLDGGGQDYRERERFGVTNRTFEGDIVGAFYGLQVEGIFQNQDEIDNYTGPEGVIQPEAKPGDFKFADLDGNGQINDDDRTIIGNPYPKLTANLNLSLNYKNFDFTADIYGSFGNDVYNTLKRYFIMGEYSSNVIAGTYDNVWREDNPSTENPSPAATAGMFRSSSYYVEDGTFVRARNLVLGYTLPNDLIPGIRGTRVYIGAQNVLTLTNYSGINPEVQSYNQLGNGIDRGQYPIPRTYSVGLNVTL